MFNQYNNPHANNFLLYEVEEIDKEVGGQRHRQIDIGRMKEAGKEKDSGRQADRQSEEESVGR